MANDIIVAEPEQMSMAWLTWLEQVAEEDRKAAADVLRQFDTSTHEGVTGLIGEMMSLVLEGKISPVTAFVLIQLLKEMQTSLMLTMRSQGVTDPSYAASHMTQVTTVIQQKIADAKLVKPEYVRPPESADVITIDAVAPAPRLVMDGDGES